MTWNDFQKIYSRVFLLWRSVSSVSLVRNITFVNDVFDGDLKIEFAVISLWIAICLVMR